MACLLACLPGGLGNWLTRLLCHHVVNNVVGLLAAELAWLLSCFGWGAGPQQALRAEGGYGRPAQHDQYKGVSCVFGLPFSHAALQHSLSHCCSKVPGARLPFLFLVCPPGPQQTPPQCLIGRGLVTRVERSGVRPRVFIPGVLHLPGRLLVDGDGAGLDCRKVFRGRRLVMGCVRQ